MERNIEQGQELEKFGIAIRDLGAILTEKVETCNAQHLVGVDSGFELYDIDNEVEIQVEELTVKFQSFDPKIVGDAEIKKLILELRKKVHKMLFEDSSTCANKDVNGHEILEFEHIRPHSNRFPT